MMKRKFAISSLLIFIVLGIHAHPVHVSIINMDIDDINNKVNLSVKLFYDDFQAVINHLYNTDIDFEKTDSLEDEQRDAVLKYISTNLLLQTCTGDSVNLVYSSLEKQDNTIMLYFFGNYTKSVTEIIMRNSLMLDFFLDQKNMVIYHYEQQEEGIIFDRNTIEHKINLSSEQNSG